MKTELLRADKPGAIGRAAAWIKEGALVAFPTDTLYGIGVDAFNPAALDKLYEAKGRPAEKGIPVLLADAADLDKVVVEVPLAVSPILERFWPGPLTVILRKRPEVPSNLSPNEGVAVRVPDHEVARRLIRAAGGAVATSSANRSGEPAARTAAEALAALEGWVAAVLDGGSVPHGVASTVVDYTCEPPRILRPGPVAAAELGLSEVALL